MICVKTALSEQINFPTIEYSQTTMNNDIHYLEDINPLNTSIEIIDKSVTINKPKFAGELPNVEEINNQSTDFIERQIYKDIYKTNKYDEKID